MRTQLIKCPNGSANPAVCCANGKICPRCGAHGQEDFCKASDCDVIAEQRKPHRVIYSFGNGQTRARVFPNLELANAFAKTVKVIRIHPASENPEIPQQNHRLPKSEVQRDMCTCGKRTKLTSDPCCFSCGGISEHRATVER